VTVADMARQIRRIQSMYRLGAEYEIKIRANGPNPEDVKILDDGDGIIGADLGRFFVISQYGALTICDTYEERTAAEEAIASNWEEGGIWVSRVVAIFDLDAGKECAHRLHVEVVDEP
jgi:hypothetical protein